MPQNTRPALPFVIFKERVHEGVGVEGGQVAHPLASANVLDGQTQLRGDGERDAAARRAVELGEDDATDPGILNELLGLQEAVLTGGRVDH
jgi:hypothetical protein